MRRRSLHALGYLLAWAVVAVPAWAVLFTHSSSEMVLASHDAVVHPTLDGHVRLDMGPYVPDLRTSSGGRIGVLVEMRKTTASTTGALAQRYAAIAAHPAAEQERVTDEVEGLARDAALRAAAVGLVPIGIWLVLKTLPEGTVVQATGPAVQADGMNWRPIRDADGNPGWVVTTCLEPA